MEAEHSVGELQREIEEQKKLIELAKQEAEELKRLLQDEENLRKQAEEKLASSPSSLG